MNRNPFRLHLLALGLYSLLAVVLSWPLVVHLGTHVPGIAQWAFDESTFIWNIWTFKQALVDNLRSPLHSELIWYPLGIDLILYTYNFFHAIIAQPLLVAVCRAGLATVALGSLAWAGASFTAGISERDAVLETHRLLRRLSSDSAAVTLGEVLEAAASAGGNAAVK